MVEIVRGGSPRPIKDYLTSEVDGINWIKIGDTEKGEKYINNVKEKINFKNNIGQENKLLQIEIYKFTNFCKLQNYTSVNIFSKDIFEAIVN
ncbi:type I restriction-modification system, S subunit [Streptococcus pneumoniae]|nr:type I restriction-modification system, S subunit [Streptococcus pneumoniae]